MPVRAHTSDLVWLGGGAKRGEIRRVKTTTTTAAGGDIKSYFGRRKLHDRKDVHTNDARSLLFAFHLTSQLRFALNFEECLKTTILNSRIFLERRCCGPLSTPTRTPRCRPRLPGAPTLGAGALFSFARPPLCLFVYDTCKAG